DMVDHIPPLVVVAQRELRGIHVAAVVLVAVGRTADLKMALRSPRTIALAALTGSLVALNWSVYVWAVFIDRTIDTALGYFINPLISVAMGAVLLGERLERAQLAAVGLALVAVAILTMDAGGLPWISLVLAFSFASYGFLRKTLPIGPSQGFFLETLILAIPAILYVGWLQANGAGHFVVSEPRNMLLLAACGTATAVPLLLFGFGARLLRLSTLGLMQYIAPTLLFLVAVFVFHEPLSGHKAVAFVLIWVALALYSWSTLFRAGR